jgi:cell division protein FtsA
VDKIIRLNDKETNKKIVIEKYQPDEVIFALDIGTRTIIGIVGVKEKDSLKVVSAEVVEHKNRAMIDGQIHDINQVVQLVNQVKEKLERSIGMELKKVAVAAAGRVLRTCKATVEREIDSTREIDRKMISSLEIEGIQKAQSVLEDSNTGEKNYSRFYCIGYSIINYYLNGYVISEPEGHKGNRIGADVLATFLPHIVIDSLYTVMNRVGLEVASLTLEPIAAINVAIPKDLRMLNLALVDIGAGTSDIAITRDGSVTAYAMAPIAGDEITERIAHHYLVDFNTGERIKTSLSSNAENITFTDILGKKHVVDKKSIARVIDEPVRLLADTISKEILQYNHKSPNAVFLIGGGSRIPGIGKYISEQLGLPEDRVVVRGRQIIQNIRYQGRKLSGPESITPIGIAVTALQRNGQDFFNVTVNGKKVRLFNTKKLLVLDALLLIGFNPSELIGRTGKSITFYLNGEKKVVRGEYGTAAEIYVNDNAASLDTEISIGDNIKVVAACDGKDAEVKAGHLLKDKNGITIFFNGEKIQLKPVIYINSQTAEPITSVNNGDRVEIKEINTVKDVADYLKINLAENNILVNGKPVEYDYLLSDNDNLEITCSNLDNIFQSKEGFYASRDIVDNKDDKHYQDVTDSRVTDEIVLTVNGKIIKIKDKKKQHIFVDIFNFIEFDLSKPQGSIILKLNGKQAAFTDSIKNGDVIEVYWRK